MLLGLNGVEISFPLLFGFNLPGQISELPPFQQTYQLNIEEFFSKPIKHSKNLDIWLIITYLFGKVMSQFVSAFNTIPE